MCRNVFQFGLHANLSWPMDASICRYLGHHQCFVDWWWCVNQRWVDTVLLVGAKSRSLLTNSTGASPCTISTPGISTVATVSSVCTPGRVSSTIVLTSPLSIFGKNSYSASPITQPAQLVKIGWAGIPLAMRWTLEITLTGVGNYAHARRTTTFPVFKV